MRRALSCLALILALAGPAAGQEDAALRLAVDTWLEVPAAALPWPALADEEGAALEVGDLLAVPVGAVEDLWPAAGLPWTWPGGETVRWKETAADRLLLDGAAPAQALAAFYVEVDRFAEAKLVLRSGHLLQLFVDGKQVQEKKKADAADAEEIGSLEAEVDLMPGKHVVLVRVLRDPTGPAVWSLDGTVEFEDGGVTASLAVKPLRPLRLEDLLDARSMGSLDLSDDGEYLGYQLQSPGVPAEGRETWREIRRVEDGVLVRSFRGEGGPARFAWLPGGHRYSFTTTEKEKTSLWVASLESGVTEELLSGIEDFGSYRWMPDGNGVIYSVHTEKKPPHEDFKRYAHLADRWPDYRQKSHLYRAAYPGGATQRLTGGIESTSIADIASDGKTLLFSRTLYDFTERPFTRTEYYELDLATLEATLLTQGRWIGGGLYSPDGKRILFTGGPSDFDGVGRAVPDSVIPNDYDTQAFLMDRSDGTVAPITKDFDPAVESVRWSKKDGGVYLTATDRSYVQLFRYDVGARRMERVPVAGEVVGSVTLSRDGGTVAYIAESSNEPERIFVQENGAKARPRVLSDPNGSRWAQVELGEVEDWSFTAADGTAILGRVYYPPDFDPARAEKWPCIVYYYGGTAPITRDFGGRYPKNFWAANGFVVYTLQPSGSTGFGQDFSSRHVNDWGKRAGRDILEGTEKFLAAHDFVDPQRVGCIGASYGGFMTMYLVSHSDLYAGAVSHAGISFLGSYWGEGNWGAFYSAVATADKYPWNDPDLYTEQGALFSADAIHTPLLMLHGGDDDNVPPGESEQLYTALKVLGREVEFIRIAGENHWILQYPHRELWSRTIVAWFDRTLKGDSRLWDHLWEEEAED
jgi:dipeptidyl aminopeptidase/acylaminoacyl peptidase